MNFAISSDHSGFKLKQHLVTFLQKMGCTVQDLGTRDEQTSVDYPDFALKVAQEVAKNAVETGIIIDGAGIGSSIVANKVPGIRAALCNDLFTARNSREHNNANLLVIGSQVIGPGMAEAIVDLFLKTAFAGGRHERRVKKIDAIDQHYRSTQPGASQAGQIEEVVSRIVHNFLNQAGAAPPNPVASAPVSLPPAFTTKSPRKPVETKPFEPRGKPAVAASKKVITSDDVRDMVKGGRTDLMVAKGTLITPLAMDTIRDLKVTVTIGA